MMKRYIVFLSISLLLLVTVSCVNSVSDPYSQAAWEVDGSPQILKMTVVDDVLEPGGSTVVVCAAADADGDDLFYSWTAQGGSFPYGDEGNSVTWKAPAQAGAYVLNVTVTDGKETVKDGIVINVSEEEARRNNSQPSFAVINAYPVEVNPGAISVLIASASDANGDELVYFWDAEDGSFPQGRNGNSVQWQAPRTPGEYVINAHCSDGIDTTSESITLTVLEESVNNNEPVITDFSVTPEETSAGGLVNLLCVAQDSDGDALTYKWQASGGSFPNGSSGLSVQWKAPANEGIYTVWVQVTDKKDTVSEYASVRVGEGTTDPTNNAPVITSLSASSDEVSQGETVNLQVSAEDEDGDALSYMWLASGGSFNGSTTSATAKWVAPQNNGTYTITARVTDRKDTVSRSFAVTVGSTAGGNQPPDQAFSPEPADGATGVSAYVTLDWQGSDPDGDPLNYTVYIGASNPPPFVESGVPSSNYYAGELQAGQKYYWQVGTNDGQDITLGPIWSFTIQGDNQQPGGTWSTVQQFTEVGSPNLYSLEFPIQQFGYIAGDNGVVLHSTDFGQNWESETVTAAGGSTIRDMFFINPAIGWAVGDNGLIMKTMDYGATWTAQNTPATSAIEGIHFYNPEQGFAVGENGVIMQTNDGGVTWTGLIHGSRALFTTVYFINSNVGFITGSNGTLLKTTDQGATWNTAIAGTSLLINSITFIDQNTGWICGAQGFIAKTSNGGDTWTTVSTEATGFLSAVRFFNAQTGYIVGESILSTTDGGATWSADTVPEQVTVWDVNFPADQKVFGSASSGYLFSKGTLGR